MGRGRFVRLLQMTVPYVTVSIVGSLGALIGVERKQVLIDLLQVVPTRCRARRGSSAA